jgi:chromosomal replication initiation ATPase DnaA
MSEKKEVEDLIKNIHQGLKKIGLKELNNGLIKILSSKDNKAEKIDFILNAVCKEFNITLSSLKMKYPKGPIQDAKQISYCLLHLNLNLTIRYIAEKIFNNWPTSVYTGIKRFKEGDPNHKADKYFLEKYYKLEEKLNEYLTKEYN